ncbi:MAG: LysR family transcriptional regulator [Oscillospiraceae bacterium]|nr:LysR family transcriptional regulator [Oscillospiraceae bacterium]
MTIRQLEYFCAVVEEKSVSAAARKLHVAQPPISRQIGLLEQELGAQLFRRGNKGMMLTDAGQSLYQQGRAYISDIERLSEHVRSLGSGVRGVVRVGLLYSTVPYGLPYLRAYHEAYPQVELYIRLGSPQDLLADLNRGELNVLFLRAGAKETIGLKERILGSDALRLIVTAGTDPAPELDAVPIERLRDVPMCLLRSDDLWGYTETLLKECQRCGFSPNIVCQCYDTPMSMQLVQSGFGVSFLPESIVQTLPHSGIYAKPVLGLSERSYVALAWNENDYHSASVEVFTRFDTELI